MEFGLVGTVIGDESVCRQKETFLFAYGKVVGQEIFFQLKVIQVSCGSVPEQGCDDTF